MKVLLTGATGFIGRQIVQDLQKKKIDFTCYIKRSFKNEEIAKNNNLKVIYGTLEDTPALMQATKEIDTVIHLAALLRTNDKTDLKIANVDGTKNILQASILNNVKHFIFISSYLALPQFSSYYGYTKREAEKLVKAVGINYTILKPTLVYGKDDYYLSSIASILKKYKIIPLPADFNLQPVHVSDVSNAVISCINNKKAINKEYMLAGPSTIRFSSFISAVSSKLSLKRRTIILPAALVKPALFFYEKINRNAMLTSSQLSDLKKFSQIDIDEAKKDLKFNPISLEQGLSLSI